MKGIENMHDLIKYELPSVIVKASHRYLGTDRQIFSEHMNVYTDPVSPDGLVRPVGLEIDPDVAPHLMVRGVKVGMNSQFVSAECVPATLFTLSPSVDLHLNTIGPGSRFSVDVSCVGLEDVTFRGRLLAVPPTSPASARSDVLGFGYTEVCAGKTVEVVTEPLVALRLTRLHVPAHLLGVFRVDALFLGKYLDVEQASSVVDSRQLGRESLGSGGEIALDPYPVVGIAQPVTVRVTNVSATTQYFSGALLGKSVRGNVKTNVARIFRR
jgi:hypothetical protein